MLRRAERVLVEAAQGAGFGSLPARAITVPRRGVTALAIAWLFAGCATPPGPPAVQWQALARGVDYRIDESMAASRMHVVRIDLRAPGLRLAVSPLQDKGLPPDRMASGRGALVSINASFFDARFNPMGITASGGQRWGGAYRTETSPLFGCDAQPACGFQLGDRVHDKPRWTEVVAGRPWLLRDGRARGAADDASCAAFCAATHPRTAIGLDGSRRWLLIVLAEGRRPGMPGIGLAQLAQQMARYGAHEALNLDGGGSSMLLIRGQQVMARPANEPELRAVANVLHVFVDQPTH